MEVSPFEDCIKALTKRLNSKLCGAGIHELGNLEDSCVDKGLIGDA